MQLPTKMTFLRTKLAIPKPPTYFDVHPFYFTEYIIFASFSPSQKKIPLYNFSKDHSDIYENLKVLNNDKRKRRW